MTVGKHFEGQRGYPTPDTLPEDTACRVFRVPASDEWLGVLMWAAEQLTKPENWYDWGSYSPQDAADAWEAIVEQAYEDSLTGTCGGSTNVPTPFWDDVSDVDDEATPEEQTWYGYVTDLDTAPSTTFVEDALLWTFTGILAVGVDPGLAIAFHTVAPKLMVAIKSDPVAVIRVWFDDILQGEYTDSDATDGIINAVAIGDPALDGHDLYIVNATT